MDKPFSMLYEEFRMNIANAINNSGLPPAVLESVLQNYLTEINNIARNQYKTDKSQYEKLLFKDEEELKGETKEN